MMDHSRGRRIKVIILGDSAVGKSTLAEKFVVNEKVPCQLSTHALTMYQHQMDIDSQKVCIDIWDIAAQEKFNTMRPSYYHKAQACILVFDVTKPVTYRNLTKWYYELREFSQDIPCVCAANKIDVDMRAMERSYELPTELGLPLYFVSAANGTNVVNIFKDVVQHALAKSYQQHSNDYVHQIREELDELEIDFN